jgi:hypothetical protein
MARNVIHIRRLWIEHERANRLNMSEQTEAYRSKALECLHAAQGATDAQVKLMYLDLAGKWRDLADQTDVLDRQRRTASN